MFEKTDCAALVKFFKQKGLKPNQIHKEIVAVCGEGFITRKQCQKLYEFGSTMNNDSDDDARKGAEVGTVDRQQQAKVKNFINGINWLN